jgi:hypothetical protein
MQAPGDSAPTGRALLALLAEGKSSADTAAVARALGMFPSAFDKLALRAYPLSPHDSAAHHLVRDISRILVARTTSGGLATALADLAAAASDPKPDALLSFLVEAQASARSEN